MDEITKLNLLLAVIGCITISLSLHYKKEGKNIEYGTGGFTKNLAISGKIMFIIGMTFVAISIYI